jgi:uncharacterized protein YdeI (YjbR/CyaY-like superfamily)
MPSAAKPRFFKTPADFRAWLLKHHDTAPELLVGFYKKGSGKPSMTWPESVDEALCVGWIDGIRRRIDDDSYSIRFTPRRSGSIWSAVNTKRVAVLTRERRMRPAGLAAFEARDAKKTAIYSYERETAVWPPAFERQFRANAKAWTHFNAAPPSYRRLATYWVTSAKQEATRQRRLATLIASWEKGQMPKAHQVGQNT